MSYFDEQWYLQKYPDVRDAIARGVVASGLAHFQSHGQREGRLSCDPKLAERMAGADKLATPRACHFDRFHVTSGGTGLIVGWIDGRSDTIQNLNFIPCIGDPISLRNVIRYYREDVAEKKSKDDRNYDYGVWILFDGLADRLPHLGGRIRIDFASGCAVEAEAYSNLVSPDEMCWRILEAIGWPSRSRRSPADLAHTVRPILTQLTADKVASAEFTPPTVYGTRLNQPALSIVSVVEQDHLILRRAALFAGLSGLDSVEFVCVRKSQESASSFYEMCQSARTLYGLNIVAISVTGNAGFAAASNHGARMAAGKTLLFLHDRIIPGDRDCMQRVLAVASRVGESDVIGAQLLTEDNSVQHRGRVFKLKDRLTGLWSHEEPYKGLPFDTFRETTLVDTDAIDAGAMLLHRAFFLKLEGFNTRYLTDEYVGSDYCLRAHDGGARVAIDPSMIFYRPEQINAFPRQPQDWAASLMDCIFFNEMWRATIEDFQSRASG